MFKGGKYIKKHLFICGITGSGKTTYALDLYKNVRGLKIFVNTQYEVKVTEAGHVCNSLDEVVKAFNDGVTGIVYNPPEAGAESEIEELRKVLFKVGKLTVGETQRIWCHVFFDEVHNFGENLNLWFQQGRRWGITCIAMSQRPALTSHTILTQCENHIVFLCSSYEAPYFEKYHIPVAEYEEWLKKPYHYIVVTPRGIAANPPIEV